MALLSRFEMVPGEHKTHPLRNGSIFLVVIAFLLYCGYTRNIPFINEGGQIVKARFTSAPNVNTRNQVRVHGVTVGEVKKIERDRKNGGVIVTMKIKPGKNVTVYKNAKLGIWWRTLLGRNMYIDIDPGDKSSGKTNSDYVIPESNTTSQIEFDQLLDSYDEDGRKGVQTFITEFDKAFKNSKAPGASIEALPGAMNNVAEGLPPLRGENPGKDIPDLVNNASKTLGALAKSETDLAGLIDNGAVSLGVTAARRQDIGSLLQQAPQTLSDTRVTMARLRTTLNIVDPIARDLRPGVRRIKPATDAVRPALVQANTLLPNARALFTDLRPTFRDLRTASRNGQPLVRDLQPVLQQVQDSVLPWAGTSEKYTGLKNGNAIGPFLATVASSSADYDANGHSQRFGVQVGLRSFGENPCGGLQLFGGGATPTSTNAACTTLYNTLSTVFGSIPGNAPLASDKKSLNRLSKSLGRAAPAAPATGSTEAPVKQTLNNTSQAIPQATSKLLNTVKNVLGGKGLQG